MEFKFILSSSLFLGPFALQRRLHQHPCLQRIQCHTTKTAGSRFTTPSHGAVQEITFLFRSKKGERREHRPAAHAAPPWGAWCRALRGSPMPGTAMLPVERLQRAACGAPYPCCQLCPAVHSPALLLWARRRPSRMAAAAGTELLARPRRASSVGAAKQGLLVLCCQEGPRRLLSSN